METMLDNLPEDDDNSIIIRELRKKLHTTEKTLAHVRNELDDALEREQMVVQYNRELLVKIAEMDELTTCSTNSRQVRRMLWEIVAGGLAARRERSKFLGVTHDLRSYADCYTTRVVKRTQSCGSLSELGSASPSGSNNDLAELLRRTNSEAERAEQKGQETSEAETSSRKQPKTEDRT
eukprot:6133146-Pyramimonas_sp.AAC.1